MSLNAYIGESVDLPTRLEGEQKDQFNNPRENYMQPLADVMKTKNYPIGWSYHSYSRYTNYDVGIENWYTLRYRRIIEETGLQDYPLYITEAGVSWQGWKKVDAKYPPITPDQYFKWLVWLDERFKEDDAVKGVTLWQIGDMGDWQHDDLTPIAGKLEQYIRTHK
ncbi:MAG: hypothetical protein KBD78_13675 [Oligoflexales bacterium]|nr:hypothetical protein [Oligoflexales bacterium]